MGQYYSAVILKEDKIRVKHFLNPRCYNNGAKLMEHSWMKNSFVGAFESLLLHNPLNIVWAGDYADNDDELDSNVYDRCTEDLNISKSTNGYVTRRKYIVNHDKKQFINKSKVPSNGGWVIHPLPLMVCEGNGRGGGDFYGQDPKGLVGSWARDLISIESMKPKGFEEIIFDLVEE